MFKDNRLYNLSDESKRILQLISNGGALRIPYNDSEFSTVVKRANIPSEFFTLDDWNFTDRLIVKPKILTELLNSAMLGLLTRKRHFDKIGWEELGLDGTKAEFWLLLQ